MKHLTSLILACSIGLLRLHGQTGCTDPQALNFDASAAENDGSCNYPATTYAPVQVAELPAGLAEGSGLAWSDGRLWAIEDGGNPLEMYELDTLTGALLDSFLLTSTTNHDWEDLAQNGTHFFIGDFGNNAGNRTDLRILRFPKSALAIGNAQPDTIDFSFSDQADFDLPFEGHDFDCEAFFFWGDSLHLFSKNWADLKTRHYVLPAEPGSHTAMLRDSLDVQGQVTAADISPDGKALLLGYNVQTGEAFFWLLFDFPGSRFFSGNKRRISLGSVLTTSQAEGLAFSDNKTGFICSERYSLLPQRLLRFDIGQWVENPSAVQTLESQNVAISPNPFDEYLHLAFGSNLFGETTLTLYRSDGALAGKWLPNTSNFTIPAHLLIPGIYWLVLQSPHGIFTKKLVKI